MISYSMLCNSVKAYKTSGLDEDRNPVSSTGTDITRVYCVASIATRSGTNGAEKNDVLKLYYDVQNSRPLNYTFSIGDKVVFEGRNYHVNSISPYYNANGLQYYEIGLV